jgi:hypothetical protein
MHSREVYQRSMEKPDGAYTSNVKVTTQTGSSRSDGALDSMQAMSDPAVETGQQGRGGV